MDMHHHDQTVEPGRMWRRLRLTGYRSLEVPGPGAVAHMSLHQKPTMSKSRRDINRRTAMEPRFYTGGPAIRLCWRPMLRGGGNRQRLVGEGAYMGGFESGRRLFAILFRRHVKMLKAHASFCLKVAYPRRAQAVSRRLPQGVASLSPLKG